MLSLSTYDNQQLGCYVNGPPNGPTQDVTFIAAITQSSPTTFTLDSCPPNADCGLPMLSTLELQAPQLYVYIPNGAFVEVHVTQSASGGLGGCANTIMIRNVPTWGGAPNPAGPASTLWFAASEGALDAFPDAPFLVSKLPLGCYPGEPSGCGKHEDYALTFEAKTPEPTQPLTLSMGGTAFWSAPSGESWMMRDMRSYETGYCDDVPHFGYWITQAQVLGD